MKASIMQPITSKRSPVENQSLASSGKYSIKGKNLIRISIDPVSKRI